MIDKEAVRVRNLIKAIGKVTKKRHAAQVLTQNVVRQAETVTFEHVIVRSRRPNRINSIFLSCLTALGLNVPIGRFYASINAPYAHLIHKISFYRTKKHPNVCICAIFVVPL